MLRTTRDPAREHWERDCYTVLLHVSTLVEAGSSGVAAHEVARSLAMDLEDAESCVAALLREELLRPVGGGLCCTPTPRGSYYLSEGARRRRSVRFPRAA